MEHEEAFLNGTSDSPRFGDEKTLRGAQPVVPLAEIRANRMRNSLLLTFALLIALGLGAGAAMFLDHLRQPRSVQSASKPEPGKAPNVEDPTVAGVGEEEEMMDLPGDEPITDNQVVDNQDPGKQTRRTRVARIRSTDNDRQDSNNDSQVVSSQEPVDVNATDPPREPILVDQWEEKRSRRVTSNQRITSNQRAKANRRPDLFRIRDIFEGARPE